MKKADIIALALYLGFQETSLGYFDSEGVLKDVEKDNTFDAEDLKFGIDWNWTMAAVAVMEAKGFDFNVISTRSATVRNSFGVIVADVIADTRHLAVIGTISIIREYEKVELVMELTQVATDLLMEHINNDGHRDYPEKEYTWLVEAIEEVEIGYFKQDPDSDFSIQLQEEGFTMTAEEAISSLETRIEAISQY